MAFEHRGGSFLNANFHWHVKATDGVFAAGEGGEAEFFEAVDLDNEDVAELEAVIRRRILP